jgi:hypothetical protein
MPPTRIPPTMVRGSVHWHDSFGPRTKRRAKPRPAAYRPRLLFFGTPIRPWRRGWWRLRTAALLWWLEVRHLVPIVLGSVLVAIGAIGAVAVVFIATLLALGGPYR